MDDYAIQRTESHSVPFPHFATGTVFHPALADELLSWLETKAPWFRHEGQFYDQYECNLLINPPTGVCSKLFREDALVRLGSVLAMLFGTELSSHSTVVAHKLGQQQGIGLHTDDPHGDDERETHRLVVHLNRGWKDSNGGHLLFFCSDNLYDLSRIIRPLHNTGVGFALSSQSYHAVSEIRSGLRYSIVYSFWELQRSPSHESGLTSSRRTNASHFNMQCDSLPSEMDNLLQILKDAGVDRIEHSQASLYSHLVHTCRRLQRWNCPPHVTKAGLFHSAYGTETFPSSMFSIHHRRYLQALLGREAEELVFLYCVSSGASLCDCAGHGPPFSLVNWRDRTAFPIAPSLLAELLTMRLADLLEQSPRMFLDIQQVRNDARVFEQVADMLPSDAVVEMRWVFEPRNTLEGMLGKLGPEARDRVEAVVLEAISKELSVP
jgi:hypothetical protein